LIGVGEQDVKVDNMYLGDFLEELAFGRCCDGGCWDCCCVDVFRDFEW
jgi:hypothetical protein